MTEQKSAYAAAGVNIEAGELAVTLMKDAVAKTHRAEVLGGLGGFAGFFDGAALKNYKHPILATSTDGVGTKVAIAQAMGIHHTIGIDLIGMLVDDLVVVGAEPLFVTDYIACGQVVPQRIADIVRGIADGCVRAGCALLGGETAEHPGLLDPQEYDIAGATTGVVEKDKILGASRIKAGDVVLAMASSGLHSNGYSLVRHILLEKAGLSLEQEIAEFGRSLGEELLEPTRIYAKDVLSLIRQVEVHAFSHITGGGLANNLSRVIPSDLDAIVDRATWSLSPIFDLIQRTGNISRLDIETTLNMGVGMVAVLSAEVAEDAISVLLTRGLESWICGEIVSGTGKTTLIGDYS